MIDIESGLLGIAEKLHILAFLLSDRSCGYEMTEKESYGLSIILQECSEDLTEISEVCGEVYKQGNSKEKASETRPETETSEA